MKRRPFLEDPQAWTRSTRVSQHPTQYANAYEGHVDLYSRSRATRVMLVGALVVATAALLMALS